MKKYKVLKDIPYNNKGLYGNYREGEIFAEKGKTVVELTNDILAYSEKCCIQKILYGVDIANLVETGVIIPLDEEAPKGDMVNHPPHYTWFKDKYGVALEEITGDMTFNLGNVVKYVVRHGHKFEEGMTTKEKAVQDLEKAVVYLNFEIKRLKG